jgi:hypothetical protein
MFTKVRNIFGKLSLFIKWITETGFFDMTRAGNIIFGSFIIGGLIIKYIKVDSIKNIVAGILGCILLLMMYLGYFMV